MTQRTEGSRSQEEQDAEYKVMERAAQILDKGLTEGRVYVVLVFDEESPTHRKHHSACMTNAAFDKAGAALYVSSAKFRDMAVADGMGEVHTDDK